MAYTLEPRQEALFSSVVTLWRPTPITRDANKRQTNHTAFDDEPAYVEVAARLQPKGEASKPSKFGRSNYDIIVTTDILRVHIDQEIDDGWLVRLDTPGHPEQGTYFATQGGVQSYDHRAKSKTCALKRVVAPPGLGLYAFTLGFSLGFDA
jgi:hypothetical protein